jgi:hypothetical protein
MNTRISLSAARVFGCTLIGALLLVGCSTKPGAVDIEKALTETFQCPMLEVSDVKKTDGIATGAGYEVSYTYKVNLVGGGDAAIKLFPEWLMLLEAKPAARLEIERLMNPGAQAPPSMLHAAELHKQKLEARFAEISPCETPAAYFALQAMAGGMQEKMNLAVPQVTAPVGLQVSGAGAMAKAESGWHFTNPQLAAMTSNANILESDKSYERPKKVVVAQAVATPDIATAADEPAPTEQLLTPCVAARMTQYDTQRSREIDEMGKAAKARDEELQISAGPEELMRQDALAKATTDCK